MDGLFFCKKLAKYFQVSKELVNLDLSNNNMTTKPCPYCAQTDTKKDRFGYCFFTFCFDRSGLRSKLDPLVRRAKDLILIPRNQSKQVSGPVSNFYNVRNRTANRIMQDSVVTFGFVPAEVLTWISEKDQLPWDRGIRW